MGRHDFRALRVRETAQALVDSKRIAHLPQWHKIIGDIPPSETLSRPLMRSPLARKARRPSRMFQPLPISYEEDTLRSEFFHDHPWELARPRLVVEDSGNDAKGYDWSRIEQPGKQLDGESVVQRQLWLMKNRGLSKPSAYDAARREFYKRRHLEDVRRRVAKEEALHMGAYFGKGPLEVGMEMEDKTWESWKVWAAQQVEAAEATRAQMFSGPQSDSDDLSQEELDEGLAELQDSVPQSRRGQSAFGGVAAHA